MVAKLARVPVIEVCHVHGLVTIQNGGQVSTCPYYYRLSCLWSLTNQSGGSRFTDCHVRGELQFKRRTKLARVLTLT